MKGILSTFANFSRKNEKSITFSPKKQKHGSSSDLETLCNNSWSIGSSLSTVKLDIDHQLVRFYTVGNVSNNNFLELSLTRKRWTVNCLWGIWMERNMFAEQGCFQKRNSFLDFTVRRWTENGIMRSPLTTDFGESNRRLFWALRFFFLHIFVGRAWT